MSNITLADGREITYAQALALFDLYKEMGRDNCHWHFNDCGCCISLHGPDCAYVIGADGESTFFAERGCGCDG